MSKFYIKVALYQDGSRISDEMEFNTPTEVNTWLDSLLGRVKRCDVCDAPNPGVLWWVAWRDLSGWP